MQERARVEQLSIEYCEALLGEQFDEYGGADGPLTREDWLECARRDMMIEIQPGAFLYPPTLFVAPPERVPIPKPKPRRKSTKA